MTVTAADIAKLDAAIVSGALTVKYGEHTITYQSIDSMLRVRALYAAQLGLPALGAAATPGMVNLVPVIS